MEIAKNKQKIVLVTLSSILFIMSIHLGYLIGCRIWN